MNYYIENIEKILPCILDSSKIRIFGSLNIPPDLEMLASSLDAKYNEGLGVVLVKLGNREVDFFKNGKITIRDVNDVEEGKELVHSILAMAAHRQMLKNEYKK